MSADWPEFQLGERCTVKSSKRIFAHEYVEQGIPFMRSKDVIDKALGTFVDYDLFISEDRFSEIQQTHGSPARGDLLMSSVGNRSGQPYVIQDEGDFHFKDGNILWLSEFEGINSDYLAYWLKSEFGQDALTSVMIGSAQKALTIDSIRKLWVRFPPIEYQDWAAEILLRLDQKIELNRQTNQTLEYMAQAIFKSWFVDFEPTRAKAKARASLTQGRLPGNDGGVSSLPKTFTQADADQLVERAAMAAISGKTLAELDQLNPGQIEQLKATAALFPETLVDSKLGEIPEGWGVDTVGSHVRVTKGRSYKSVELEESDTALVTLKSFMRGGGYREDGLKGYTGTFKPEQVVEPGDLVMSLTDVTQAAEIVGKPAIVTRNDAYKTLVASLDVAILRSHEPEIKEFFYGLMSTYRFHRYAESFATGTTVLHLNSKGITSFVFAHPGIQLCKIYASIAGPMLAKHEGNIHLSRNLTKLRDCLLPKLLSGELKVT